MLPIQKRISRYNHYDYNNPKHIVIHYVGAQSSTAKNNVDYFAGGNRNASAHYFVDNTSIWQSVEDDKGAWHVGNTTTTINNWNSIGVEMCCMEAGLRVSEETEKNALELVAHLMHKHNITIDNVTTHYSVSGKRKVCPNWNASNWERLSEFKKNLVQALEEDKTPAATAPAEKIFYRVKMQDGEQIGAFVNIESAKALAKENKAAVYRNTDDKVMFSYIVDTTPPKIAYKVKKENGEQLGAFSSLDNALALAKEKQATVFDLSGNEIRCFIPPKSLGYVNLGPKATTWSIYAVDGPYTSNKAIGQLTPSKFGGLSYEIHEKKIPAVYKIKTSTFGYVAIYVNETGNGSITAKPLYDNTAPAPATSTTVNKKGTATITASALKVRDVASTAGKHVATYYKGEKLNYTQVITANNYVWLKYTSYDGKSRYIPAKDTRNGSKFINY